MKIRKGFVSNSSSSSFILFGIEINKDDVVKLLKEHFKISEKELKEYVEDNIDFCELMEYVEDNGSGLVLKDSESAGLENNNYALGVEFASIQEEYMGYGTYNVNEIEEKIKPLKKLLNKESKIIIGSDY